MRHSPDIPTLSLEQIIEKNTRVRLKIVGTRVDATEIVCPYFVTYVAC
jgi:hypothetical protein